MSATSHITRCDGYNLAVLDGELDVASTERLQGELVGLLDAGEPPLIIDLSSVTFCDSWGLSTILAAWQRAEDRDVPLALVGPQPRVLLVMEITGTDTQLPLYRELSDAIADVTSGRPAGPRRR
jgi:anti-sigma B factor antagonist